MSAQTGQERRSLSRFRASVDDVLEWFAIIETFPSRRADDLALRAAIEVARPPLAAILAVLERMERPDRDSQKGA